MSDDNKYKPDPNLGIVNQIMQFDYDGVPTSELSNKNLKDVIKDIFTYDPAEMTQMTTTISGLMSFILTFEGSANVSLETITAIIEEYSGYMYHFKFGDDRKVYECHRFKYGEEDYEEFDITSIYARLKGTL